MMNEIDLSKKEWMEILEQNRQFAKNYFVNYLIASNAIKLLEDKLRDFPDDKSLVKEQSGEVLAPSFPSPDSLEEDYNAR